VNIAERVECGAGVLGEEFPFCDRLYSRTPEVMLTAIFIAKSYVIWHLNSL
jgi:hypothetical protein